MSTMEEFNNIQIPSACVVCDTPIGRGNSILLHCECFFVFCQTCAYHQIASQYYTYLRGLNCPTCRVSSYNIKGIEMCQSVERKLVNSATKFFLKEKESNNRKSNTDDAKDTSVRNVLKIALQAGYTCNITLKQLLSTDNLDQQYGTCMLRLELARLEKKRLNKIEGIHSDSTELPLGPLEYLTFTRNIMLEHALEMQTVLRKALNSSAVPLSKTIKLPVRMRDQGIACNIMVESSECQKMKNVINLIDSAIGSHEQNDVDLTSRIKNGWHSIVDLVDCKDYKEGEATTLCVCGDEEGGFYIQCYLGMGGCNGWVHPECVPSLQGMSKSELESLEYFICPLCEDVRRHKIYQFHMEACCDGAEVEVLFGKLYGFRGFIYGKSKLSDVVKVQLQDGTDQENYEGKGIRTAAIHIRHLKVKTSPQLQKSSSDLSVVTKKARISRSPESTQTPERSEAPQKHNNNISIPNKKHISVMDLVNEDEIEKDAPAQKLEFQKPISVEQPKKLKQTELCVCDGFGSGTFVECMSEDKCVGRRFYHAKCIGYIDSLKNLKPSCRYTCTECIKAIRSKNETNINPKKNDVSMKLAGLCAIQKNIQSESGRYGLYPGYSTINKRTIPYL